jgi:Flp pilus assembly protein TadD
MAIPFLNSEDFDERAHEFYDAGEYDKALDLLREGLSRYPGSVDLHIGLGYVRLAREEFAWARRSFEEALRLDPEHEDAWVGLGEAVLKFGCPEEALRCFARVNEFGLADDLDLGLAIGRALYREGLFRESRDRLSALAGAHPDSAEVLAALGYTLHALGDEVGARRELRRALRLDEAFHEARIYLSHLLFERGDHRGALRELERVPPDEHWDSLSLWRTIELKCSIDGCSEQDPRLVPWRARLADMDGEPDAIDHLLAEVEAAFEGAESDVLSTGSGPVGTTRQRELLALPPGPSEQATPSDERQIHRVCTADGEVFMGTWEQIVVRMRDTLSDPTEPVSTFMSRAAERVRKLTGCALPCTDAEAFLRGSARIGLLRIEA